MEHNYYHKVVIPEDSFPIAETNHRELTATYNIQTKEFESTILPFELDGKLINCGELFVDRAMPTHIVDTDSTKMKLETLGQACGRILLLWLPKPEQVATRSSSLPRLRAMYSLGSCVQLTPAFKNNDETCIIVATALHLFTMNSETHYVQSVHYSRAVNTNPYLLRKTDCFPGTRIVEPKHYVLGDDNDYHYAMDPKEAKATQQKWFCTNDCAFVRVNVPSPDQWSTFVLPQTYSRTVNVPTKMVMVSYASPLRKTGIASEYSVIRGFVYKGEWVMSPDQCMEVNSELRFVYTDWDRKHIATTNLLPYHEKALGYIIPHSGSGIGGSSGAPLFSFKSVKTDKPSLVGLQLGAFPLQEFNCMMTVNHPAFVAQYIAYVYPMLPLDEQPKLQSYIKEHEDIIKRYCPSFLFIE